MLQDTVQPIYTLYYYNDFVYRIVKPKRSSSPTVFVGDREEVEGKYPSSVYRARSMVLQYALCNHWDYFITITLNPRYDRSDLDTFRSRLTQWIRDYRKSTGEAFRFVLVPELHKKYGAWHFHGLVSGVRGSDLAPFVAGLHPRRLVLGGYLNFSKLAQNFGFVSLSPIRNPVAVSFYLMKYLTKDMGQNRDYYSHLYFASRGLNKARPYTYVYQYNQSLEDLLDQENEFCKTGWAITDDWSFPFISGSEYPGLEDMFPRPMPILREEVQAMEYEYEQLELELEREGYAVYI